MLGWGRFSAINGAAARNPKGKPQRAWAKHRKSHDRRSPRVHDGMELLKVCKSSILVAALPCEGVQESRKDIIVVWAGCSRWRRGVSGTCVFVVRLWPRNAMVGRESPLFRFGDSSRLTSSTICVSEFGFRLASGPRAPLCNGQFTFPEGGVSLTCL